MSLNFLAYYKLVKHYYVYIFDSKKLLFYSGIDTEAADQGASVKQEKSSSLKPGKSQDKAQESNKKKESQAGTQKSEKKKDSKATKQQAAQQQPKGKCKI